MSQSTQTQPPQEQPKESTPPTHSDDWDNWKSNRDVA